MDINFVFQAPSPHTSSPIWPTILTILNSVALAVIAYRQYMVASRKLKLDLYDRRFVVYEAFSKFLLHHPAAAQELTPHFFAFVSSTENARFLFGPEVWELREHYISLGRRIGTLVEKAENLPKGPEKDAAMDYTISSMEDLLNIELPKMIRIFHRYLGFEKLPREKS